MSRSLNDPPGVRATWRAILSGAGPPAAVSATVGPEAVELAEPVEAKVEEPPARPRLVPFYTSRGVRWVPDVFGH